MTKESLGIVASFGAFFLGLFGLIAPAAGQGVLDRLDSQIRMQSPQPPESPSPNGSAAPAADRGYLGAIVDDRADRGRGVRVLSVRPGSPADRGGLRPGDLIVGAANARVRQMSDLTAILDLYAAGDKVAMEIRRGLAPARLEITLGTMPGGVPPSPQPMPGLPEAIPAPRGEQIPGPQNEGPSLTPPAQETPPAPPRPSNEGNRIEQLERRIQQLERRVDELEQALGRSKR